MTMAQEAQERGTFHAFKILLFIVLPFVAAVLMAFFLIYVPDRKTSIIERNYRVLETAKRKLQGQFLGKIFALKTNKEKCPTVKVSSLSFSFKEGVPSLSPL